jgi:hypothetical protein
MPFGQGLPSRAARRSFGPLNGTCSMSIQPYVPGAG